MGFEDVIASLPATRLSPSGITDIIGGMVVKAAIAAMTVLTTLFGLRALAQARVLHVSPQPLPGMAADAQTRTISEAARQLAAGDGVIIHGGIYREAVVVEASGTAANPIVFEAAPAEHVVVTGADLLTDWQREDPAQQIFSTPWPHRFIGWNRTNAHPGDDYHQLIGRCEQVFAEHYPLRQVLTRDKLSRGTFFTDLEGKRLYVWTANNADLSKRGARIEASVRQTIWQNKGAHIRLRGLRFRYAANMAQHGAVQINGDHNNLADCIMEYTNSVGLAVSKASSVAIHRCIMQYNGELGFGAGGAHNLLISHCTIRGNSTKGWDHGWEAGGDKICLSRGVVIEHSRFIENRGNGIWFDIGNENATIRNCLIADNEEAGIFYEIGFGLHAHDNVIIGNGFDAGGGAWGASAGIAISSSPNCRIERNLLVGNKEGFNYREQTRTTPLIDVQRGEQVAVWNHDQIVRNNVIAYNRDAQCWGWFDTPDGRHWPEALKATMTQSRARPEADIAAEYTAKDRRGQPLGLTLEKLKLDHRDNVYCAAAGQGLFIWGTKWAPNRRYQSLKDVQGELKLEQTSELADPGFADYLTRDFCVPPDSPAIRMKAYPQGDVPDVRLGIITGKEDAP